jgi:hypothetical protein
VCETLAYLVDLRGATCQDGRKGTGARVKGLLSIARHPYISEYVTTCSRVKPHGNLPEQQVQRRCPASEGSCLVRTNFPIRPRRGVHFAVLLILILLDGNIQTNLG